MKTYDAEFIGQFLDGIDFGDIRWGAPYKVDEDTVMYMYMGNAGYKVEVDEQTEEHGKGIKWDGYWYCKIGPCVFQAEWFARFIEAMDFIGATEVYLHEDGRHAALVQSDKGVCILMPVMQPDTFSEDNPNNIVL